MQIVNIHEAKTHLSRLIAKAGKPVVKVTAVNAEDGGQRTGWAS